MKSKKIQEKVYYTGIPGVINNKDKLWDDYDGNLNKDIFRNKIINIKIYYSSGDYSKKEINSKEKTNKEEKEEKYIIGISFTFKDLISRKIRVIDHRGTEPISGMKELNLDNDEYLVKYFANYNDKQGTFLSLGFSTNKKRKIIFGNEDNLDIYFNSEDEKSIIGGTFGYLNERINALGCLYFKKSILLKYDSFKFIMLRYLIKKDKEFAKKIEENIDNLDIVYKYIWETVNLPNTALVCVIKFCSF